MGNPKTFSSDAYRMFAAVARMCQSPISWYTSGPTQKFMLRQVKEMDSKLHAIEDSGPIDRKMSIALLMLYGQILYTGTSYAYALSQSSSSSPLLCPICSQSIQTTISEPTPWTRLIPPSISTSASPICTTR